MFEDDMFEDCIEETQVSVSAHLMNKSSINCASFHRGFISAFVAVSNGEVKLLIWKAIDGKRIERKRARDVPLNTALTELDVERVTFVNNNINVECDVDGSLRISVLGCTNDTLFWWEMVATQSDLSDVSLQNYICCDVSSRLSKLVFNHNAERCACVDDRSVTVRSDQLKKLRVVTSSSSASNSTAIADACFAGPEHSTLVVAYENGLVVGWDVASNDIVLKFNCLGGASKGVDSNNPHSAVSGGEPVCVLAVDQYSRIESATPVSLASTAASGVGSGKKNFFLVVGCRDGRIRLCEMLSSSHISSSDDGAAMFTHRECNAIDLKRELRFSNSNSGSGRSGSGVDYASVLEAGGAVSSSTATAGTSAISMRQELVMTPLSMCFVSAQYALEGAAVGGSTTAFEKNNTNNHANKSRAPLHSKRSAEVSVLNSHLCVVTPRNIVIVNMNTFKVAQNIPLESVGFAAHSIYSAHTGVRLAPRRTDLDQGEVSDGAYAVGHFTADEGGRGICGNEKKKTGGQQESASPVPTAFIDVVLLTSVDKLLKVISVPLFSSGSGSDCADNSNNAADNTIHGAARSSRTLGRWKSANDVTADSSTSADTHNGAELGALDLDNDEDDGDNDTSEKSTQPRSRVSVFSDPDTPLSLVRMPSLAQHDLPGGRGRSLLDCSIKEVPTPVALKGSAAGFGVKQGGGSERLLRGNWEGVAKDKKTGKVLDQPVTFHSKIKSSGYGQAPLDKFAKKRLEEANKRASRSVSAPRQQGGRSAANDQNSNSNSNSNKRQQGAGIAASGPRIRKYPVECGPMTQHQPHNNFPAAGVPTSSPIYNIAFSDDATLLGVATADSAVLAARIPVAKNKGDALCYMGHNSRINSISFSHCKRNNQQMLLSCSADGTARVWKGGRVDSAAVIFSHRRHQPGDIVPNIGALTIASSATPQSLSSVAATLKAASNSGKASTMSGASGSTKVSSSRNRPFGENVSAAQFYYMDKFVLLSVKASVLMYSYDTEAADAKNDLKRLLSTGKYKLVTEWDMAASAQNVCALACVNSVQSPVVLCATSDKMLNVLDAAVGSVVRQIESPHDKNIHCIALPQPSVHASLADSEAYNLFATSAIDNVIALWDVRTPRCIARYASHVNKREPVSCCLSPCLRYIATGSEDKTARILDLRTGRELAKLMGHRDVVSSVAFNPLFAQLATGSYDGTVRFYADPLSISQVGM